MRFAPCPPYAIHADAPRDEASANASIHDDTNGAENATPGGDGFGGANLRDDDVESVSIHDNIGDNRAIGNSNVTFMANDRAGNVCADVVDSHGHSASHDHRVSPPVHEESLDALKAAQQLDLAQRQPSSQKRPWEPRWQLR